MIARSVEHSNQNDAIRTRAVIDNVVTISETPVRAVRQFGLQLPNVWILRQQQEPLIKFVNNSIGCSRIVLSDVIPNTVQISDRISGSVDAAGWPYCFAFRCRPRRLMSSISSGSNSPRSTCAMAFSSCAYSL